MIAGLMVLAVLLFSGAPAPLALAMHFGDHNVEVAALTAASVDGGVTTPDHHDGCDHGLACCIGGQCTLQAYWMPARAAALPRRSTLSVAAMPLNGRPLAGIAISPSPPPPRSAV
jgi:hypothetical protein